MSRPLSLPAAALVAVAAVLGPAGIAQDTDQPSTEPIADLDRGEVYSQRWDNGVPLGGIGCGKLELLPDGRFGNIVINNNWDRPLDEPPGSLTALWTRAAGETDARLLRLGPGVGAPPTDLPGVSRIVYRGRYPLAELAYSDRHLPVEVVLTAFSPLVPHNYRDSALPAAAFTFRVRNRRAEPVELGLAFSWENALGVGSSDYWTRSDRDTNHQAPAGGGGAPPGLLFRRTKESTGLARNADGDYALLCVAPEGFTVSRRVAWNAKEGRAELWDDFAPDGVLDPVGGEMRGAEGRVHPAGALCAHGALAPGAAAEVTFVLAWHMPGFYGTGDRTRNMGHAYSAYVEGSWPLAVEVAQRRDELLAATRRWQELLEQSSLPGWLQWKLINDNFVLSANTIWTAQDEFATMESPTSMWGSCGTMDQRLCAHAAYATFFPRLDRKELRLFAELQRADGEMPHFNGNISEAIGKADVSYGLTAWPDLACSFVIQVQKDYAWTGDADFLREMLPHVRQAVDWLRTRDRDGDHIPEGGSTWDYRHYDGAFCYTASVWVAALRAAQQIARAAEEPEFAASCVEWYGEAMRGTMKHLWNGQYLRKCRDPKDGGDSEDFFFGQLAGEWVQHLTGLPEVLPPDTARSVVDTGLRLLAQRQPKLIPNELASDGEWAFTRRSWIPYMDTYFGCLAIYEGRAAEGLEWIRRHEEDAYLVGQNPWSKYLSYYADDGARQWGKWYMTYPASWFILYALEGFQLDLPAGRLQVAPNLPADWPALHAPVFAPTFWAWLDYDARAGSTALRVTRLVERPSLRLKTLMVRGERVPDAVRVTVDGERVEATVQPAAPGTLAIEFAVPLALTEGSRLVVEG